MMMIHINQSSCNVPRAHLWPHILLYTVTMYSVLAWFAPSGASAGLTLSLSFSLLVRALVEA